MTQISLAATSTVDFLIGSRSCSVQRGGNMRHRHATCTCVPRRLRPGEAYTACVGTTQRNLRSHAYPRDVAKEHNNSAGYELLIGTSGYSYPDWKGTFYPRDLKKRVKSAVPELTYLSHYFNFCEI